MYLVVVQLKHFLASFFFFFLSNVNIVLFIYIASRGKTHEDADSGGNEPKIRKEIGNETPHLNCFLCSFAICLASNTYFFLIIDISAITRVLGSVVTIVTADASN